MVSTPPTNRGMKTMSSQTVASMSAQSGADGAFAFTPAANPKCPATTVLVAPRPRPRQSRIQHADHGDEQNNANGETHKIVHLALEPPHSRARRVQALRLSAA